MQSELRPLRIAVLLAVLAVLAYANALTCGFAFDDQPDIRENAAVTGGVDILQILASPLPPGDLYRPFTVLTFALNERIAPGNAAAYHAVNIMLHAVVTVLVFCFARRLMGSVRTAIVAAALFAVHPIHTEAVTSLVGRAELLAALCGLIALLAMVRSDTARHAVSRLGFQVVSLICFALALLSKESAFVLVPLLPLFRIACRRQRLLDGLRAEWRSPDWVPYLLCAALCLLLRYAVVGAVSVNTLNPLDNVLAFVPWGVRIRSALGILWDYFGLLNVPLVLGADYSYAQVPLVASWISPRCLAGLALLAGGTLVVLRDSRPAVTFAVILPFAALSLTSNLLFPIGTIKGERLLYFPSIGWAILVASGIEFAVRRTKTELAIWGLVAITTAAFAARTWTRNLDWKDNDALYRSMVRSAPNSAKSRYNFGVALQQVDDDAAAIAQFRRALDIYPFGGGAGSALGIGIIYDKHGLTERAVEWYEKALDIEGGFGKAHTNLCRALLVDGRFEAAAQACRRGLRYEPTDANLLKGLGESLIGVGERDKGIAVLQRSLALNRQDQELQTRLAFLEAAPRRGDQAVTRQ